MSRGYISGAFAGGYVVNSAFRTGGELFAPEDRTIVSPLQRSAARDLRELDALKSFAPIGGIVSGLDSFSGASKAIQRVIEAEQKLTDAREKAVTVNRNLKNQLDELSARQKGDLVGAARASFASDISDLKRLVIASGGSGDARLALDRARQQQAIAEDQARRDQQAINAGFNARDSSIRASFGAAQLDLAGQSVLAFDKRQKANREDFIGRLNDRLVGKSGYEYGRLKDENDNRIQAFDEDAKVDRRDFLAARRAGLIQLSGQGEAAELQARKDFYKADLREFDAAWDAKLSKISDVEEFKTTADARDAKRAALLAQQERQQKANLATFRGLRQAGELTAQGRVGDAFTATFNAATEAGAVFQDLNEEDAFRVGRAAQFRGFTEQRRRALRNRFNVATLAAQGQFRAADARRFVQDRLDELAAEPAESRPDARRTILAEIAAERRRTVGPAFGGAALVTSGRDAAALSLGGRFNGSAAARAELDAGAGRVATADVPPIVRKFFDEASRALASLVQSVSRYGRMAH